MSLDDRDHIRNKFNGSNISFGEKGSKGFEHKKTFDSEFDRICEERYKEKECKKKQYYKNIRPHIVYMDENGKIYKRDFQKKNTEYNNSNETKRNKYRNRTDVTKVFIIFMIVVIIYLVFDLFNVGINIY